MRPTRAPGRAPGHHVFGIARLLLAAAIGAAAVGGPAASVPVDRPPRTEGAAGAAPKKAAGHGASTGPRLVLVLVLDQFRADYLDRFLPRFGQDGFKRLLRDGTYFTGCAYPYAFTETAPGHATIATGTTPDRHGIVANEWYDAALGRTTEAIEDPEAPLSGPGGVTGASPRRLLVETLGDVLRRETKEAAKVWAVAGKDRAAIFSAGLHPSGAIWYDKRNGRMTTSRYYGAEPPEWLRGFNGARPAERLLRNQPQETRDFASLRMTSQFHDLLFQAARTVVSSERLGTDDVPDLLFLGLSATDLLGHEVGPFDERLADLIVRLDAQIADFLRFLDQQVGPGRTIVALTSDHGVAPTRDQAVAAGLSPPSLDRKALRATLEKALAATAGADRPAPRIRGSSSTRLWFNANDLARAGMTLDQVSEVLGKAAQGIEGIAGWVTPSRATVDAAIADLYRLSRYPGRSPDLCLVPAEYATGLGDDPTTHGSPWPYDRRVPLLFAGVPFRHGERDDRACTPADLAPTLAAVLHLSMPPAATGRGLPEALAQPPAAPALSVP